MGLGNLTTGPSNIQRKNGEATSHVQQLLQTVCWKFAALQPSHCHYPRPALEAEGWEKPHGAVKSQIVKPGAGQHGNKCHAWCAGHVPLNPAQKLQSHFANFLRIFHEPFVVVMCTQAHTHCV